MSGTPRSTIACTESGNNNPTSSYRSDDLTQSTLVQRIQSSSHRAWRSDRHHDSPDNANFPPYRQVINVPVYLLPPPEMPLQTGSQIPLRTACIGIPAGWEFVSTQRTDTNSHICS